MLVKEFGTMEAYDKTREYEAVANARSMARFGVYDVAIEDENGVFTETSIIAMSEVDAKHLVGMRGYRVLDAIYGEYYTKPVLDDNGKLVRQKIYSRLTVEEYEKNKKYYL